MEGEGGCGGVKGGRCGWEVVVGDELSVNSKPPPIGCNNFCIMSKFITSCVIFKSDKDGCFACHQCELQWQDKLQ